jgi:hypothetical protein
MPYRYTSMVCLVGGSRGCQCYNSIQQFNSPRHELRSIATIIITWQQYCKIAILEYTCTPSTYTCTSSVYVHVYWNTYTTCKLEHSEYVLQHASSSEVGLQLRGSSLESTPVTILPVASSSCACFQMSGHAADLIAAASATKPSLTLEEMGELHRAELACTQSQNATACRSWLQLLQKVCIPRARHGPSAGGSANAATAAGTTAGDEQTTERPRDGWACFDIGQLYSLRLAEFDKPALAASYYQRACDQNHYRGCYNLAMMCVPRRAGRFVVHARSQISGGPPTQRTRVRTCTRALFVRGVCVRVRACVCCASQV